MIGHLDHSNTQHTQRERDMSNTHTQSTQPTAPQHERLAAWESPDAWRDVWSDDREANRVAARIAQSRADEQDMSEWLAAARAAIS